MPDRYGECDPADDVLWGAEQRRQRAIENCGLCNEQGVRGDLTRCDHRDYSAARERGMAEIRKILRKDTA